VAAACATGATASIAGGTKKPPAPSSRGLIRFRTGVIQLALRPARRLGRFIQSPMGARRPQSHRCGSAAATLSGPLPRVAQGPSVRQVCTCEHAFVTSHGSIYGQFKRALERKNSTSLEPRGRASAHRSGGRSGARAAGAREGRAAFRPGGGQVARPAMPGSAVDAGRGAARTSVRYVPFGGTLA